MDADAFAGCDWVAVHPQEPFAANVLRISEALVCAEAAAHTADRLRARGLIVHQVDVSELAKAEAGVTCCSVLCYFAASS